MSLLDRVQRKAEDASPSGGVAAQPAPPPTFALPSASVPTLASLAAPPSESLAPTPSWSVRTSPANSAPPVAAPRRALEPAQFGRPAPAQAPPPPLRVRPSDTSGLGDANRPTSLLSRTGDSAGSGDGARISSLLNRTGEAGGTGDGSRPNSLLSRTGIPRPGQGQRAVGAMYAQLRTRVHQRLVEELAGNTDSAPADVIRQRIAELVTEVINEQGLTMRRQDRV